MPTQPRTDNLNSISSGTVVITGPTSGLGRATTLSIVNRPAGARPDLILIGRDGPRLVEVADVARASGATVHAIGCDLARLSDVRDAAQQVKDLVAAGAVRPLRGLVANAGVSPVDATSASEDGFELTFAVNHLAHAQLIDDLVDTFSTPARIVLLGSNTYHQNWVRRILHVPPARWRDPLELARPATTATPSSGGIAYSDSKLAILYYAHELQRQVSPGINVSVFEPGFMPGTGLSRQHGESLQRIGQLVERIPGISTPARSGPALASVVLDDRWAHLADGAFVVKHTERDVKPVAVDPVREARLWKATRELLEAARQDDSQPLPD